MSEKKDKMNPKKRHFIIFIHTNPHVIHNFIHNHNIVNFLPLKSISRDNLNKVTLDAKKTIFFIIPLDFFVKILYNTIKRRLMLLSKKKYIKESKEEDKKQPFIKLYSWFYLYPSALTGTELKVILTMSFLMSWNTNLIMLDPPTEEILLSRLAMSHDYFYKVIRRLEKKGMLKKDGWYYEINTKFSGRG